MNFEVVDQFLRLLLYTHSTDTLSFMGVAVLQCIFILHACLILGGSRGHSEGVDK